MKGGDNFPVLEIDVKVVSRCGNDDADNALEEEERVNFSLGIDNLASGRP